MVNNIRLYDLLYIKRNMYLIELENANYSKNNYKL